MTWFISEHILNAHAAVVVFFVLSGYVLTLSLLRRSLTPQTISAFYLRRAFRIYPALFVGVVLGSAYVLSWAVWPVADLSSWAAGILKPDSFSAKALIASLSGLGVTLLPPLWTIKVELIASLILPLVVWCASKGRAAALMAFIALAALSFAARSAAPLYLVQFAIGATIAVSQRHLNLSRAGWITVVSAVVLLCFRSFYPWSYHHPLPSLVEGLAGAALVAGIASGGGRLLAARPLVLLGDWSYGIYLFHLPIALAFARMISTSHLPGEAQALVIAGLTLGVTIPFSWLVFRLIERPGIALGHRLSLALDNRVTDWMFGHRHRTAMQLRAKKETAND